MVRKKRLLLEDDLNVLMGVSPKCVSPNNPGESNQLWRRKLVLFISNQDAAARILTWISYKNQKQAERLQPKNIKMRLLLWKQSSIFFLCYASVREHLTRGVFYIILT